MELALTANPREQRSRQRGGNPETYPLLPADGQTFSGAPSGSGQSESDPRSRERGGGGGGGGDGQPVDMDVVQFSEGVYFALEGTDFEVEIDIIRLGGHSTPAAVCYKTEDASAMAGSKYIHASGVLEFGPEESVKSIRIGIVNDIYWGTTMEFKVLLSDPVGCRLAPNLRVSRVKIIDDDMFPTNMYKDLLQTGEVEKIGGLSLMLEYFRLNFHVPEVKRYTVLTLVVDQLHNLYFLLTIYLNIYLVDVVFGSEAVSHRLIVRHSREQTAMWVAAIYTAPLLILHLADIAKTRWDPGAPSKAFLQTSLFRKLMNFDESARDKASPSDMSMTVINETRRVVEFGYMKALNTFGIVCRIVIMTAFVCGEHRGAATPVLLFPILVCAWSYAQIRRYIKLGEEMVQQETDVAEYVRDICRCYRLVADYHQRSRLSDGFASKVSELNRRVTLMGLALLNGAYLSPWLATIFAGGYIVIFSRAVLSGALSLGHFLAMLRIFVEMGDGFKLAHSEVMDLVRAVGPLCRVTSYMNGGTDLLMKRDAAQKRRGEMKRKRNAAFKFRTNQRENLRRRLGDSSGGPPRVPPVTNSQLGGRPLGGREGAGRDGAHPADLEEELAAGEPLDLIQICVRDLNFSFASDPQGFLLSIPKLEVAQGCMVAIVGGHRVGKTTFLKLLASILDPKGGLIFVPPHLRVLHVTQDPILLEASLWENLTFGNPLESTDRVRKIMEKLKLEAALEVLDETEGIGKKSPSGPATGDPVQVGWKGPPRGKAREEELRWMTRLSATEHSLIHLARALIVNPEVLIAHRPMIRFNESTRNNVMEVLADFVESRGIEPGNVPLLLRRPRTCFYTSDFPEYATRWAHKVWEVEKGSVKELDVGRYK